MRLAGTGYGSVSAASPKVLLRQARGLIGRVLPVLRSLEHGREPHTRPPTRAQPSRMVGRRLQRHGRMLPRHGLRDPADDRELLARRRSPRQRDRSDAGGADPRAAHAHVPGGLPRLLPRRPAPVVRRRAGDCETRRRPRDRRARLREHVEPRSRRARRRRCGSRRSGAGACSPPARSPRQAAVAGRPAGGGARGRERRTALQQRAAPTRSRCRPNGRAGTSACRRTRTRIPTRSRTGARKRPAKTAASSSTQSTSTRCERRRSIRSPSLPGCTARRATPGPTPGGARSRRRCPCRCR